jgi:hypothetical protein
MNEGTRNQLEGKGEDDTEEAVLAQVMTTKEKRRSE